MSDEQRTGWVFCNRHGAAFTPWELDTCRRLRGHKGPHRSRWSAWTEDDERAHLAEREAEHKDLRDRLEAKIASGEITREEVERRARELVKAFAEAMGRGL